MTSQNDIHRVRIQRNIGEVMNKALAGGNVYFNGILIRDKHHLASIAVRNFLEARGIENVPEVRLWEK